MIISASYKTDIPTFYGDWFMNRLRAGLCKMTNPYSGKPSTVSLRREDVEGFVFWTKNVGPFLKRLPEVKAMGYPFVVQHTINGYPRALEHAVVDAEKTVAAAAAVRDAHGPRALVWRYDTIVFSSLTPYAFHVENFGRLAQALRGVTDEVVISFAHLYSKTKRNMDERLREQGATWADPPPDEKRSLASELLKLAEGAQMRLTICSQPDFLVEGAGEARCVDADRLRELAGARFDTRLKGNRKECGCFESRDIGDYDTCPHGCAYCYAVQNRPLALERFRAHDPESEFLFPPRAPAKDTEPLNPVTRHAKQLKLFRD